MLADTKPDFLIVVAYGGILPQEVLGMPTRDILNVHASLLPRHRGASPIQYALLNGDTETGVCVMRITSKLDAGPVFATARLAITSQDTTLTLMQKLAQLGAKTLCDTLKRIMADPTINPQPQDENLATHAPKIKKEMALIDWQKSSAEIDRQIRALMPWPVAQTSYHEHILKIHTATPLAEPSSQMPATIVHLAQAGLTEATGVGSMLLTHVQPEGKKVMSAFAWAQGTHLKMGDIFSSIDGSAAKH
jgi:methionyl-tRNA formyltransferase